MRVLNLSVARSAMFTLWMVMLLGPAAHAQTASTLKVLDWNTHHGVGSDGVYSLQRFVTWIARSGAHVVSLNEVEKFTGWGNEDQPARYAALLKAATGKTWYYTFAQREGATNGQGNLILSTIPFEGTGGDTLSYARSVARAEIVVNGVRVNLFSTHLDADSSPRRKQQMLELQAWAAGFSQQRIFAGDFNAWPGAGEIGTMTAIAYDAWATAKANGTTVAYTGNEAGNTRNSRIDYIWYSKQATRLVLKRAEVFDTRDAAGVMPSDHRPVMATFQVGSASATTTAAPSVSSPSRPTGDFDGDLKSDLSVYRPGTSEWFVARSGGTGVIRVLWGTRGDVPVAADYDGDGRQDIAVFRPSSGAWHIVKSATGTTASVTWGGAGDIPVVGDYDGDRKADVAVWRPLTGTWYIIRSATGTGYSMTWGGGGDIPAVGDYDGDGKSDIAVFRPSSGVWHITRSATGTAYSTTWGGGGDIPVVGDYDGDSRSDVAVFRPSNGTWYLTLSSTGGTFASQWGVTGDRSTAGDYDGDGRTDLGVFRPATGTWHVRYSISGATTSLVWGGGDDVPLPGR
jgi:endonuclease/exonuclease/phosphatase family metal-dependent hydrolase